MRKPKNDTFSNRFSTRVENHLEPFYLEYLKDGKVKEFTERLGKDCKKDKKEVVGMAILLKKAIDKFYIENKVEDKYIYFSNIYEIHNMMCEYFFKNSKFVEFGEVCDGIMDTVVVTDTELFGYQTAFSKELNKAVDDISNRFYKSIIETSVRYVGKVRPERKRTLEKEIDNISIQETLISTNEKAIKKEVAYINGILNRVKYARNNIDLVIQDISNLDNEDKRIRKNIKWLCTRTENILKTITKEL